MGMALAIYGAFMLSVSLMKIISALDNPKSSRH